MHARFLARMCRCTSANIHSGKLGHAYTYITYTHARTQRYTRAHTHGPRKASSLARSSASSREVRLGSSDCAVMNAPCMQTYIHALPPALPGHFWVAFSGHATRDDRACSKPEVHGMYRLGMVLRSCGSGELQCGGRPRGLTAPRLPKELLVAPDDGRKSTASRSSPGFHRHGHFKNRRYLFWQPVSVFERHQ